MSWFKFSSVAQSYLTLRPHGLQHTSPPCPSRTLELAQTHVHRVHPTVSSSVVPFSSCLISFPASGSFPVGQFFASGCQIFWVSASASNPYNEYSGLISFWIDLFRLVVKLSLKDFEGNLASLLNEHSCVVVWPLFGIALLWDWNESWSFLVLWPLLSFPNWLTIYWVQHITF